VVRVFSNFQFPPTVGSSNRKIVSNFKELNTETTNLTNKLFCVIFDWMMRNGDFCTFPLLLLKQATQFFHAHGLRVLNRRLMYYVVFFFYSGMENG
jgi:hypothetical protein